MTNTTKQVEQELSDAELELAVGGTGVQEVNAAPAVGPTSDTIKLQMAMQRENTQFTTVSNVLKLRHDTEKNSISNIR